MVSKAKLATCCVCGEERMIFHSERAYAVAPRYHWRCSGACEDRWDKMKKPTFICRIAECKCDEAVDAKTFGDEIRLAEELASPPRMPRPSVREVLEAGEKRKADDGPESTDAPPPPRARRFRSNVARMSSQPHPPPLDHVDLVHRQQLIVRYNVDDRRDWPARIPGDRTGNIEAALQHLMEEMRMLRDSLPCKIEELAYPIAVDAARDESVDVRELEERVKACEEVIERLHDQD